MPRAPHPNLHISNMKQCSEIPVLQLRVISYELKDTGEFICTEV